MKNLKQLQEKYSKYSNGLGHIQRGGKSYYEINSDKPLNLNSDFNGFILNELGQVECYEFFDATYKYFMKGLEISEEDWTRIEDEIKWCSEKEEELQLEIVHDNCRKWRGLTLDNYYPHPYYPEKEVKAFEVIRETPYLEMGEIYEVFCDDLYTPDYDGIKYSVDDCLQYPEFFRPVY